MKKIFQLNNLNLLQRLLESDEPILCDSFSDLNDDVINFTIAEHGLL